MPLNKVNLYISTLVTTYVLFVCVTISVINTHTAVFVKLNALKLKSRKKKRRLKYARVEKKKVGWRKKRLKKLYEDWVGILKPVRQAYLMLKIPFHYSDRFQYTIS